jgi:hypothetical protein
VENFERKFTTDKDEVSVNIFEKSKPLPNPINLIALDNEYMGKVCVIVIDMNLIKYDNKDILFHHVNKASKRTLDL